LEFFDKDPIEWKQDNFEKLYTSLIQLKQTNEALLCGDKRGTIKFLFAIPDSSTLSFSREQNGDKVIALFNLSADSSEIKINDDNLSGNYNDFFSGELKSLKKNETFYLQPWEYKIFVR
jgi:cyclomaltodextrinase / maltogenic alpha-amylase / neopullulanase